MRGCINQSMSYIKTKKKCAEFWKAIYYELEQGEEIK